MGYVAKTGEYGTKAMIPRSLCSHSNLLQSREVRPNFLNRCRTSSCCTCDAAATLLGEVTRAVDNLGISPRPPTFTDRTA
jgi:hypothetical protein